MVPEIVLEVSKTKVNAGAKPVWCTENMQQKQDSETGFTES